MAERSSASDVGIGIVGAGLGLALVLVVLGLRSRSRTEAAQVPSPPVPPEPQPEEPPILPSPEPPQPQPQPPPSPGPKKDESRLTFVMTQPGFLAIAGSMRFEGPEMRAYSLKEMIDRIKAGGRHDVTLATTGARPASADYARAYLFKSGIFDVWDEEGRKWTLGPDSHLVDVMSDDPDVAQYRVPADKKASRVAVSGNGRGQYGAPPRTGRWSAW